MQEVISVKSTVFSHKLRFFLLLLVVIFSLAGCKAENDNEMTTDPALAISSISPEDGTTDVPVDTSMSVTFNRAVVPATITTNKEDTTCSGTFQVSVDDFTSCIKMSADPLTGADGKSVSVTPASTLAYHTCYKTRLTPPITASNSSKQLGPYTNQIGFITKPALHGTVYRSAGGSLTLTDGTETVVATGNGPFQFTTPYSESSSYNLQILQQPANQTCTIQNGSGTVGDIDVKKVSVNCSTVSQKTVYTGADLSTSSTTFTNTGLPPITMTLAAESNVLLTFSCSTYTTNDGPAYDTILRLLVDGSPVARTREQYPWGTVNNISFVTIQKLSSGTHTISTDFSIDNGTKTLSVYGTDPTIMTATVVETLPGLLGFASESLSTGATASGAGTTAYNEFGLTPISLTMPSAGKLLLGLTMPEISIDSSAYFYGGLELNGTIEAEGLHHGDANFWNPKSFFTATGVSAGTHTIRAKWKSSIAATLTLAATSPAYLTAVALDSTVQSQTSYYTGGQISTASGTYADVPDLAPISLTVSKSSLVLISFLAAHAWSTNLSGQGVFRIFVDGSQQVAQSRFTTPNSSSIRSLLINTIETLAAGSHTIKVQWKSGSGTVYIGAGTKSTQLSATVIE